MIELNGKYFDFIIPDEFANISKLAADFELPQGKFNGYFPYTGNAYVAGILQIRDYLNGSGRQFFITVKEINERLGIKQQIHYLYSLKSSMGELKSG